MEIVESRAVPGRLSCLLTGSGGSYFAYSVLSVIDHVDELLVLGDEDAIPPLLAGVAKLRTVAGMGEALAACTGEWLMLLAPDQVYADPTAVRIERWLRGGTIHRTVRSLGWPRWRFTGDLNTIEAIGAIGATEQPGGPASLQTRVVRNVPGLRFVGELSALDLGWVDADGRRIGIDCPSAHAAVVTGGLGVHDYSVVNRPTTVGLPVESFDGGHPEVFWRHDRVAPALESPIIDPSREHVRPAYLARPVLLAAKPPVDRAGLPQVPGID